MLLLAGGGFIAVLGTLLYYYFPNIIEYRVRDQVQIKEGNDVFDKWLDVPVAITYGMTLFNVENPREALRGAKVKVREVGPYYFKQYRRKKIISWGENNGTVRFYEYRTFYFDHKKSRGLRLSDNVTVINAPLVTLGQQIHDMIEDQVPLPLVTSPLIYGTVNAFLDTHQQTLFTTKTVREVIFGYRVNFLRTIDSLTQPLRTLGLSLGMLPQTPGNSFGILYNQNGTPEGPYEVYTGQDGTSSRFASIVSWKGLSKLIWWKGDPCNQIKGSDATQFPPFVQKTDLLYTFAPDICRTVYFRFREESQVKGIRTYRFEADPMGFADPSKNPENECFCLYTKGRRYRCSVDGAFDLGGCSHGAPALLSNPHFYSTAPDLAQTVDGLFPDKDIHFTFIDVEPMTGAVFYGSKKLQISLRVEQIPLLRGFGNIRNATVPLIWLQEEGGLNDELADEVKGRLVTPLKFANFGILGLAVGGWIAFLVASIFYYRSRRKKMERNEIERMREEKFRTLGINAKTVGVNVKRDATSIESMDNFSPGKPEAMRISWDVQDADSGWKPYDRQKEFSKNPASVSPMLETSPKGKGLLGSNVSSFRRLGEKVVNEERPVSRESKKEQSYDLSESYRREETIQVPYDFHPVVEKVVGAEKKRHSEGNL